MSETYDVVVAGSGAAGLSAALTSAARGARVVVLEAAPRWGGTTGISAGAVWVPGNHLGGDGDAADCVSDALTYCLPHAPGRDPAVVAAFVRAAAPMARAIEELSPIRWSGMQYPDTFPEAPGGRTAGRHIEVEPLGLGDLGPPAELVWPMPWPPVFTNDEVFGGGLHGGGALPYALLEKRMAAGEVTMGLGLVAGLLRGCRDAGVTLLREARVTALQRENGRVTGVVVTVNGTERAIAAGQAVILACGGFEWAAGLADRQLGAPTPRPLGPPVNRGDAARLAASAGAELAHLGESWSWPALTVPGETWELAPDHVRHRQVVSERMMPHVIWVNQHGRRFVNEAAHNCALALTEIDPGTHQLRHAPAFAVGDAQFRARYSVAGVGPGADAPQWMVTADSLTELAERLGIDGKALEETVAVFNDGVARGVDEAFARGCSFYDRYNGDPTADHPTLGSVETAPFFAVEVHRGAIATKGGARINGDAQVVTYDGDVVEGLYAAGTAAAALFGPGAIANGMHLSFALTGGWLAATHATRTLS